MWDWDRLGLDSLFNGISAFVGYLMPRPTFLKDSSGTITFISGEGGYKGGYCFPKS